MHTVIDEVNNVSECMLEQKDIPDHLLTRRIYIYLCLGKHLTCSVPLVINSIYMH